MLRPAHTVVLDSARVREVAAVFHGLDAVERAGEALLLAGFDRADIDVVASPEEVRRKLGAALAYVPPEELADIPGTPRQPFVASDDIMTMKVVVSATFGALVAVMAALVAVLSGASPTQSAVWALFLGLAGAGGGFYLARRFFGQTRLKGLGPALAARGIVMWVRAHSDESEWQAREMLLAHGGEAVRVHEIELVKTEEDLPLSRLRPDPWLGSERLGQP